MCQLASKILTEFITIIAMVENFWATFCVID